MVNRQTTTLQAYFEKRVDCYEQAYFGKRETDLRKMIYRLAWFPLRSIFKYTMEYVGRLKPLRILDVGCGNGVYSVELGRRGAMVTGIDNCEGMIDAAGDLVERYSVGNRVSLVCADYMDWAGYREEGYDALLAIGVLDYAERPDHYLASFRRMAPESIVTFPARSLFTALGSIVYRKHGIRCYSYSRKEIDRLLQQTGLQAVHFEKIVPSTYWVHVKRTR